MNTRDPSFIRPNPIIPEGVPNPIGNAQFLHGQNRRRRGGELVQMEYPLITSSQKTHYANQSLIFNERSWHQMSLLAYQDPNQLIQDARTGHELQRRKKEEMLRQTSDELKMYWTRLAPKKDLFDNKSKTDDSEAENCQKNNSEENRTET